MHSFSLSGGALNGQRDSSVASFQVSHGARLQRLHRRLAEAHPEAESMGFLHQLLDGHATPRQIAGLIRGWPPAIGCSRLWRLPLRRRSVPRRFPGLR